MNKLILVFGVAFLMLAVARANDRLADLETSADEVVTVTLNAATLQGVLKAMPHDDPDDARLFKALAGVSLIKVRTFEFHGGGMPEKEDIDALRAEAAPAGWSRFLMTRSNEPEEMVEGYVGSAGMSFVVAEPGELTMVRIEGVLSPADVPLLGGHFGLPSLQGEPSAYGIAPTPQAEAADRPDKLQFKEMVREIEHTDGIHRIHIPLLGLAKPIAVVASGGRAHAVDLAIFEDAPPRFVDSVDSRIPRGWYKMVEVRDGHERTNIYVGEVNRNMALLVATWDGDGVLVTVKASLRDLTKAPLDWTHENKGKKED